MKNLVKVKHGAGGFKCVLSDNKSTSRLGDKKKKAIKSK